MFYLVRKCGYFIVTLFFLPHFSSLGAEKFMLTALIFSLTIGTKKCIIILVDIKVNKSLNLTYMINGRPQAGKIYTEKFGTYQCTLQYFNCSNNNSRNLTCPTTHYFRADFLEELLRTDINHLIAFTNQYKDEFLQILRESSRLEHHNKLKATETEIERLLKRNEEFDKLFSVIYEDKIKGTISEEHFETMSKYAAHVYHLHQYHDNVPDHL